MGNKSTQQISFAFGERDLVCIAFNLNDSFYLVIFIGKM